MNLKISFFLLIICYSYSVLGMDGMHEFVVRNNREQLKEQSLGSQQEQRTSFFEALQEGMLSINNGMIQYPHFKNPLLKKEITFSISIGQAHGFLKAGEMNYDLNIIHNMLLEIGSTAAYDLATPNIERYAITFFTYLKDFLNNRDMPKSLAEIANTEKALQERLDNFSDDETDIEMNKMHVKIYKANIKGRREIIDAVTRYAYTRKSQPDVEYQHIIKEIIKNRQALKDAIREGNAEKLQQEVKKPVQLRKFLELANTPSSLLKMMVNTHTEH